MCYNMCKLRQKKCNTKNNWQSELHGKIYLYLWHFKPIPLRKTFIQKICMRKEKYF